MASLYNVSLQTSYNFTMYAPAILGQEYKNAKVLALLDFDSAYKEADVSAMHAAAYPYLPVGTIQDPTKLIYIKTKTSTGDLRIFAMDWIAEQPTLVTATTLVITIENVDVTEAAIVRQMLYKRGYTDITIKAVTS